MMVYKASILWDFRIFRVKGMYKKDLYQQIKRGSGEHIMLPWRMCNMHSAAFVLLKVDVVCYVCSKFQYILGPDCLIYSFRFCVHHFASRSSRARVANFLYAHLSCDIQGIFCNLSLVRCHLMSQFVQLLNIKTLWLRLWHVDSLLTKHRVIAVEEFDGRMAYEVKSLRQDGDLMAGKCWTSLHHMGVSKNRGTPKSSILIGFSIINHPFWGTPIFGNTHIFYTCCAGLHLT